MMWKVGWAVVVVGAAVVVGVVPAAEAQGHGVGAGNAAELEEARRLDQEALSLLDAGRYDAAVPLAERALAIREKALGPDHPEVATALDNLALLYANRGEYDRAEPLYQRALAIDEKALGPDGVATDLHNLADLYASKSDYDRAEPLYQRALAINEKALGPDHPDVAQSLNGLAELYREKAEYDRAGPLYERALAILQKALGPDHPDVAQLLNNLALLYEAKGEYARAESHYQRALAVLRRARPEDPHVVDVIDNLATLYWGMGRMSEAVLTLAIGEDADEKTLGRLVAAGSEAQKRAYLSMRAGLVETTITLALQAREPRAARLALTTLLRRKGRALDATAGSMRALRARLGPDEQKLFDELKAARSRYVSLALRGPGSTPLDAYRKILADLDDQIQRREGSISEHGAAFGDEAQPITTEAVDAFLPEDTALVEWAGYKPFNPRASTERERLGPPRYAACVLFKRGDPLWVDLGDAKTIDADIEALRAALRRPANNEVSALSRALEARVMAPVRALLGATRRVFLSPDGALNLVPFAALLGDDGHPLIERYAFTYLTSGRDLLRLHLSAPAPARDAPLILAGPDFNAGAPPGAGRFQPMLHADEDAAAIARLFPGASVLLRDQATKARLQKTHGPRLLHIGTHGFFEPIACSPEPQKTVDDPWLRSGIALAGANACASGHDDGLLTALEASGLDLYGTRLAVLSACETGVGDVKAGDGVYGLRRALVLAGAETQVMSLWSVDDDATSALMRAYYERLARGEGRSEAMRQVQLAMLHGERRHPYYWASFIVSGDDRTLDGRTAMPDLRVRPGGACACRLGGEGPAGSATWLGGLAAIGAGIARTRRRGRGRP